MFVRFVSLCQDEDSHCLQGVFQAAYWLRDEAVVLRSVKVVHGESKPGK